MTGDGSTIKRRIRNLLRSPSVKIKDHKKESLTSKVTLEKVLGVTASGNSGLACDPHSGAVAYPAGCVVVLLNPKKNQQNHLINTSRKTITALAFSPDGRYLVTGESGHLPAVRLWDVTERRQVAELQKHKYGISCVAFSPNSKYIVSVGNQHDMTVNVWAWKKDVLVASNKVSSKVMAVSFSEDSSYFVTAGLRHVKFWYLDPCKPNKASVPVPLLGRSGLLGELRNNVFCDVACGRGSDADSTFCITSSGLLCEFNGQRTLDKWVDLRTAMAHSLSLSEEAIFCGCADGTVRCFSPADLRFICTLPRPHPLGAGVSAVTQASSASRHAAAARYPDAVALTYDPVGRRLSCVYNDHSMYVWDVCDVRRVGKVHSALFHAACVWDLQTFPDISGESGGTPSPGRFISCSADSTIRLWCAEEPAGARCHQRNAIGGDLMNVIYTDENPAALLDPGSTACALAEKAADGQAGEVRAGIRSICVSPDGKHLASGDRNGMLRVHDLSSMEEILKVEAHDAEILCLEYSKPETGLKLLASASRDRLIHVFDAEHDHTLLQTLDEHSSSITAVRFAANDNKVRLISCGADKSVYFRTAHRTDRGAEFRCSHHVVRKTTLYDMGVDPTCKYAAVGCQDRGIRIFNISNGKQKKLYKGSLSEDGSLLKVQMDPSGLYVATSCSDKSISLFDFHTGECVANMFGHSEIVTGMKFTNDCRHLISVSGDSCIFVWRLAPELTVSMRERLCQLRRALSTPPCSLSAITREGCRVPTQGGLSSGSDPDDTLSNTSSDGSNGEEEAGVPVGGLGVQAWESTKAGRTSPATPDPVKLPRRRWSLRMGSLELRVKSMLDLRQLGAFSPARGPGSPPDGRNTGSTFSLQEAMRLEERAKKRRPWQRQHWLCSPASKGSKGSDGAALCWEGGEHCRRTQQGRGSQDSRSPDSAGSLGYHSRDSSPDHPLKKFDSVASLCPDSSDEEHEGRGAEEEEEARREMGVTSMDEALRTVSGPLHHSPEDFLKQNFETLADNSNIAAPAEHGGARRLSMSSRFLAQGHWNRRVPLSAGPRVGEVGGLPFAKPPVSEVRPMMEGGGPRNTEHKPPRIEAASTAGGEPPERDSTLHSGSDKGSHLWRTSNSTLKAPPPVECPESVPWSPSSPTLHKSQSAQNLGSYLPRSPAPSSDRGVQLQRPQQLQVDRDSPRPPSLLSSPSSESSSSSGSSPSSHSPLPWESPRARPPRSYMSPTASSIAKSSRSTSLEEEGLQVRSPPLSPTFHGRRRSSDLLGADPWGPCSPVFTGPCSLPSSSSCPLPGNPSRYPAHVPPSRIPLPKQTLGPQRRGLCLELKTGFDLSPGRLKSSPVAAGEPPSQALTLPDNKPALPSSLLREPGKSSESSEESASAAGGKEHPLEAVQSPTPAVDSCPRLTQHCSSITRSTAGISSALPGPHSASPPRTASSPLGERPPPSCPSVCPRQPFAPFSALPCGQYCRHTEHSITLDTCRQAVGELHNSLRRTATLYSMAISGGPDATEDQEEMRKVLSEALGTVRAELDALPPHTSPSGGVRGEGDRALALLQQYSELLLKSVERRLDSKT